ncbi:MAG: oxidoreductase [Acidobacteria bacterium]|nr:MAG: oxidoreductase [Acidobacteriota bacterium]
MKRQNSLLLTLVCLLLCLLGYPTASSAQSATTRIAVIGLDHDHVWGLLKDIANEPQAELLAIADPRPDLVDKAKSQVPTSVRFYSDYVQMLDDAKPEAVFVTTENDHHLALLRECAKRHIHFSTEKPMATNAADAREMERLADRAGIKLMVNYWNAWVAPSHDLFHRVKAGDIGPVQRIIVQYGHQGPKEIGISKEFGDWLYDPAKNGGGAIMDFGCYGAEWALWLKGRPSRVYATTRKLKTEQHNQVDDDATIVLDYPDATVTIEPSWDWPYGMDRVYVFGTKASLLATHNDLLFRSGGQSPVGMDGESVRLGPIVRDTSNPISYLIERIRNDKPIEDPLSARLNVQVMEILDAARESAGTGRAIELK